MSSFPHNATLMVVHGAWADGPVGSARYDPEARGVHSTRLEISAFQTAQGAPTFDARTVASFLSRNSPSEIGTATLSIKVNSRNPNAKMPAATRSSVTVG